MTSIYHNKQQSEPLWPCVGVDPGEADSSGEGHVGHDATWAPRSAETRSEYIRRVKPATGLYLFYLRALPRSHIWSCHKHTDDTRARTPASFSERDRNVTSCCLVTRQRSQRLQWMPGGGGGCCCLRANVFLVVKMQLWPPRPPCLIIFFLHKCIDFLF